MPERENPQLDGVRRQRVKISLFIWTGQNPVQILARGSTTVSVRSVHRFSPFSCQITVYCSFISCFVKGINIYIPEMGTFFVLSKKKRKAFMFRFFFRTLAVIAVLDLCFTLITKVAISHWKDTRSRSWFNKRSYSDIWKPSYPPSGQSCVRDSSLRQPHNFVPTMHKMLSVGRTAVYIYFFTETEIPRFPLTSGINLLWGQGAQNAVSQTAGWFFFYWDWKFQDFPWNQI